MVDVDRPEFSVWWNDPEGTTHSELRWVDAKTAVERAMSLTMRPAARLGIIRRVIVTDGGDFCVFEWLHDVGITHPKQEGLN